MKRNALIPLAGIAAGSMVLLAGCAGGDTAPGGTDREISAEVQAAADDFDGTFTYWLGLTFPEESNELEKERIQEWGASLGIDVEVVDVNQNETSRLVASALESNEMPDALSIGYELMQILQRDDHLAQVTDLYEQLGEEHGGWVSAVDAASAVPSFGEARFGIPYGFQSNVLFRRVDVLGDGPAPATWEEFGVEVGAAAEPPETFGMGLALSNVLDGNNTTFMLQSFGARVADDAGTQCTLDTDETREFLEWITELYAEEVIPPDATTWDGAGDNGAYLAGRALTIFNSGSVYLSAQADDPELAEVTDFSIWPDGPAGNVTPISPFYRVVPSTTGSEVLAADLISYLAEDAYAEEFLNGSVYGPVLESQTEASVFSESPVHAILVDLAAEGATPTGTDTANAAFAEYQNTFSTPRMVQRVVVDGLSVDEAVAEAQQACQTIYDRNN